MADDIDLTGGGGSGSTREERRRARRERASESGKTKTTPPSEGPSEREVRDYLSRAIDGLAANREAREDEELATALREESGAMAEGVITLTNAVPPLRLAVVVILNVAIVLLAFGRVGGILFERLAARRQRKIAARQAAAEGGIQFHDENPYQPSEVGV